MDTENQPGEDGDQRQTDHLSNIDDGCGCTEIWERLSEIRESE